MKKILIAAIAAGLMGLAVSSAGAEQFDFYKLKYTSDSFDFLPTDGILCSGGDLCSSNITSVLNGDLTFAIGSLTATATGTYNSSVAAVVQDHENGWIAPRVGSGVPGTGAGLGVYHVTNDNSDDNITAGEMLTLTFNQVVALTAIGLANDGHLIDSWDPGKTFLFGYGLDPGSITTARWDLPSGAEIPVDIVGKIFTFAFDPAVGGTTSYPHPYGDQFYLSSLTVTAVPEPEIYAMMGIGLGLLGWVGRRKKLKEAAAA